MSKQFEVTDSDGDVLGVFDARDAALAFASTYFGPQCSGVVLVGKAFTHEGGMMAPLYCEPAEPVVVGYLHTSKGELTPLA